MWKKSPQILKKKVHIQIKMRKKCFKEGKVIRQNNFALISSNPASNYCILENSTKCTIQHNRTTNVFFHLSLDVWHSVRCHWRQNYVNRLSSFPIICIPFTYINDSATNRLHPQAWLLSDPHDTSWLWLISTVAYHSFVLLCFYITYHVRSHINGGWGAVKR